MEQQSRFRYSAIELRVRAAQLSPVLLRAKEVGFGGWRCQVLVMLVPSLEEQRKQEDQWEEQGKPLVFHFPKAEVLEC